MPRSHFARARDAISLYFARKPPTVYKLSDLRRIFEEQKATWKIGPTVRSTAFVNFVVDHMDFNVVQLPFPTRKETRYATPSAAVYDIAASLRPDAYFTHQTAMFLHGLTQQAPSNIYLNFEQPHKSGDRSSLTQDQIDLAFRRPVRVTQNKALYADQTIWLLNGMYTGRCGVVELELSTGTKLAVTDVERTLIDIAVRPVYSGGVMDVLTAYQLAKTKLSLDRLAATLKAMNHIYPYHQVVGFYLEKSGAYDSQSLGIFRNIERNFDFYLTHQMGEMNYSEAWGLFYPNWL